MEAKKRRTKRRHSKDKHRNPNPKPKTFNLPPNSYDKRRKEFDLKALKIQVEGKKPFRSKRERMSSGLYSKYCSSQNFFYTKEIDNILCGIKSKVNVRFLEDLGYYTELERREEMLKRYYQRKEYPKKIKLLSEYYKFHEDVPRLSMLPLSTVIHGYHDQKRRINYIKITKMLNNGKIDSEIVRNMDPNEDSDFSKGSVASSLLSFLPDEFKTPVLTQAIKKSQTPRGRLKKSKSSHKNHKVKKQVIKGRNMWNGADFRVKKSRTPSNHSPPDFYIGKLKKHKNKSGKNSMSTVKDLNSILSEIFAGNPISNRSSIKSEICEFSLGATPNSMNWSADQSEILSQSQLRPKPEKVIEKKVLVKKSVNKNILLTKFKPSNFLNGFRGHAKDDKKNFGHLGMKAFNKKSKEHQEIINNSRSPSGTMTKSFGLKSQSRRMSKLKNESNGSPANYKSNFSRSSFSKNGFPSQKKKNTLQLQNRFKIQVGKHSPTLQIRPRKMRLNISGKTGRFYNSNDHNHRQRTPNVTRQNTRQHDSYKKSLTSCFGTRDSQPKLDIINHKLKTYTRSQDCNHLNLNFKIKSKIEDYDPRFGGKRTSVKKKMRLNVFHEGDSNLKVNFRSCKQNIWKNRPIQVDLKKIQKQQINKMSEAKQRDSSNEEIETFPERKKLMYNNKLRKKGAVDFDHPIFSSHNSNTHNQWTMYNGAWKSSPDEENLYTLKPPNHSEIPTQNPSSPKKRLSSNNDLNQILKSLQNMKDSQKKRLREHARKAKRSKNSNKTRGSFKANGNSRGSLKPQKYAQKDKNSKKMELKIGVKGGVEVGSKRRKVRREVGDLREMKVMDHLMFDSKNWMEKLDGLKQLNGCNININNNFININTLQQKDKRIENALYKDNRSRSNKDSHFDFHRQAQKTYEEKSKKEWVSKKQSFSSPQGPPKKNTLWELKIAKKHSKGSLPHRNRAKTQKENSYFGHKKSKNVKTSPDQNKQSWKNFKSPKVEKIRRGQNVLENFKTGKKNMSKEMRKGSKIKTKENRPKKPRKKYQSSKNIVRSNPKKKMGRRDRPKNFSSKAEYASLKKTGRQLGPLDFRSYTNKENRRVPISCKNKPPKNDRESKTTLLGLFLQKKCENLEHLLKSKITKAKRERLEKVFKKENSQISGPQDVLGKKSSVLAHLTMNTQDRRHSVNDPNGSLEGTKIRFNQPNLQCIGSIDNNINSLQQMNMRPSEDLSSKSRIRLLEPSRVESPFNFKKRIEHGPVSQKESLIRSKKVSSHGFDGQYKTADGHQQLWNKKLSRPSGFDMMNNVTSNLILAKMRKENQMIQKRDKKNHRTANAKKNSRKNSQFATQQRKKEKVPGLKRRKSKNSKQTSTQQRSRKESDIFHKLFSNKFSEQERRLQLRSINELEDFRNSRNLKNPAKTGKQPRQQMFQKKISLPEKANRESFRLFKSKVAAHIRNDKSGVRDRNSLKYDNQAQNFPCSHLASLQK